MARKQPHISVQEQFKDILETHKGIIYKVANSYCHHTEDRADLVQEIIYQLWKSYPKYDPTYAMTTWVYRIALNTAISAYRRTSTRKKNVSDFPAQAYQMSDNTYQGDTTEAVQLLYQFINQLKELDRALMLLYLEERSHEEIADILGITKTNVATKISRIKRKLKEKFSTLTQS